MGTLTVCHFCCFQWRKKQANKSRGSGNGGALATVEEESEGIDSIGSEEDSEGNDSSEDEGGLSTSFRINASVKERHQRNTPKTKFSASEVAQAFSHFSYVATGEKRLICDIQGVYDEPSGRLMISDPVIHYYNRRREHRKNIYGRSDMGERGIRQFFKTHQCSELCKLVKFGFRTSRKKRTLPVEYSSQARYRGRFASKRRRT